MPVPAIEFGTDGMSFFDRVVRPLHQVEKNWTLIFRRPLGTKSAEDETKALKEVLDQARADTKAATYETKPPGFLIDSENPPITLANNFYFTLADHEYVRTGDSVFRADGTWAGRVVVKSLGKVEAKDVRPRFIVARNASPLIWQDLAQGDKLCSADRVWDAKGSGWHAVRDLAPDGMTVAEYQKREKKTLTIQRGKLTYAIRPSVEPAKMPPTEKGWRILNGCEFIANDDQMFRQGKWQDVDPILLSGDGTTVDQWNHGSTGNLIDVFRRQSKPTIQQAAVERGIEKLYKSGAAAEFEKSAAEKEKRELIAQHATELAELREELMVKHAKELAEIKKKESEDALGRARRSAGRAQALTETATELLKTVDEYRDEAGLNEAKWTKRARF
jgi:hypothetical protein